MSPGKKMKWEEAAISDVLYVPENAEEGEYCTKQDFFNITDNDPVAAEILFDMCEWEYPATVWDQFSAEIMAAAEGKKVADFAVNMNSRVKFLIERKTTLSRRYKTLEEMTGISVNTWKQFWYRNSSPSGEMIQAICKAWPEYAFWIATGITDPEHGHVMPGQENDNVIGKLQAERFKLNIKLQSQTNSSPEEARRARKEIETVERILDTASQILHDV